MDTHTRRTSFDMASWTMRRSVIHVVTCTAFLIQLSYGLDNGLARTPPMGWMAWERFRCQVNCTAWPDTCISEELFSSVADSIYEKLYSSGYRYISIDDCWLAKTRNETTLKLEPDATRFPSGILHLADYMHRLGFKLGIYEDYGTKTCAGYPGSINHLKLDAKTFGDWKVDMLKLDGCNADPKTMDSGYVEMGDHLNKTSRPILYACSWPDYQRASGMQPNYTLIAESCNMWRNYRDISDSWASIRDIIRYYGDNQKILAPHHGPGHWNDPDQVLVGNFGLSPGQEKIHFAFWCLLSAPLFISNDPREIGERSLQLLTNPHLIAINQDRLGKYPTRLSDGGNYQVWIKELSGDSDILQGGEYALALFSQTDSDTAHLFQINLDKLGIRMPIIGHGWFLLDAFTMNPLTRQPLTISESFTRIVKPFDIVVAIFVQRPLV